MPPVKQESAVDDFFKDLPSEDKKEQDIFDDKKKDEVKKEEKPSEEDEAPDSVKNRRHRRLEQQLQKERESNIALNERIKILSETERAIKESDGTIDPRLIRVFGPTDEGKEVARHFSEILSEVKESTRDETLREIEQKQIDEQREQKEYESFIDSELESLEDQYNLDLTSDAPAARKVRREFLELVEKLSPKDDDGTITGYADFQSTFEVYQKTKEEKPDNSRRKEIASRSMQSSDKSETETKVTPGFGGWRKDYNLE
jgi:hypothetical protein